MLKHSTSSAQARIKTKVTRRRRRTHALKVFKISINKSPEAQQQSLSKSMTRTSSFSREWGSTTRGVTKTPYTWPTTRPASEVKSQSSLSTTRRPSRQSLRKSQSKSPRLPTIPTPTYCKLPKELPEPGSKTSFLQPCQINGLSIKNLLRRSATSILNWTRRTLPLSRRIRFPPSVSVSPLCSSKLTKTAVKRNR